MRRLGLALLTLLVTGCAAGAPGLDAGSPSPDRLVTSPDRGGEQAPGVPDGLDTTVTRIVDGDTLYVADLDTRVRLIGIDTPETRHPNRGVECFGHEATAHLTELVPPSTEVVVTFDVERTDRFDRPLGYVWRASDGLHVNLAMVEDGYAQAYTVPPNVRYAEVFVEAQREARAEGRGLWSAC